tara:strand:+ start:545 stop:1441 length:897 start_codon:yes stop_codon:yes gene_type:complete
MAAFTNVLPDGFSTFSVSGQSDVVADKDEDTLNLVAGTNVTITTDDATDSITIDAEIDSSTQTFFQALKDGNQTTTTTMADLTGWTVNANPSGDYSLNTSTGELTFNEAGYYSISYSILADQSGNNRQELQVQLLADTGSGYNLVAGSVDKQYATRNNTQDEGSAQVSNLVFQAAVGDKVKVQVAHVGVSGVIGTDDAKLSVFSLGTTASEIANKRLYKVTSIDSAYTMDRTDEIIECTANSFTVTLSTSNMSTGQVVTVVNCGIGTIAVQNINGVSRNLIEEESVSAFFNGTSWKEI